VSEEDVSFIEQVKLRTAEAAKAFLLDMWLARHTPEKVLPILDKVVEAAKEEFADAVANGAGIYAVGYCFGAKYVLLLGGERPNFGAWGRPAGEGEQNVSHGGPVIKVGALAHGKNAHT
jgi:dienelactone hydrolase